MARANCSLDHVIGLVYDAASDSRRWPDALFDLKQCLDASGVALAEFNFASRMGEICHFVGYDPAYVRQFRQNAASQNVWLRPGAWYLPGSISFGEQIIASESLLKTDFYHEWLRPQGFFHRLCAVIKRDNEQIVYLEAMRSESHGRYSDAHQRLLQGLLPHLQQATQRGSHLWRLAVSRDIIDSLQFAVLVVDKRGRVLFSNRLAEEALRDQKGLSLGPNGLRASASVTDQQLKGLIERTVAGNDKGLGGALMVRRGDDLPPIWVVVAPLSRQLRRVVDQQEGVALVFVHMPELLGKMQEATLRTFYGLTAAEQRLALLILEGCRLAEAAQRLNISRNTVRTHMKRIYVKTQTDCQTDLVRMLLTGPYTPPSFSGLVGV
jgi:DNA-binding CsgD family transcriptional regulator/PAS domain-containing protein